MSPLDGRSDSCGPSRGWTLILAKTCGQEEITNRSAVVPRLHSILPGCMVLKLQQQITTA